MSGDDPVGVTREDEWAALSGNPFSIAVFPFLLARFRSFLGRLGPVRLSFSGRLICQRAVVNNSGVPPSEGDCGGASSMSMKSVAAGRFLPEATTAEARVETVSAATAFVRFSKGALS